jgi:hypothetical protein
MRVRSGSAISPQSSWHNTIADDGLFVRDFSAAPHPFSVLISPRARFSTAIVERSGRLDRPQWALSEWST